MSSKKYHVSKLNSEFKLKSSRNSSYSIRSFARDLGIDSSSLSSILNGKRKIPKGKIESIAAKVCSSDADIKSFIKSARQDHVTLKTIKGKDGSEARHQVTEKEFANISDIHTYTLLSMLEMEDFKYDIAWIAKKLKLDASSVKQKIKSLAEVGLIKEEEGTLIRTKKRTTTTDEIVSKYIIKHHVDSLELAKNKVLELEPSERYFSTLTIPCDPEALHHIKKLIMEFEEKIEAYVRPLAKRDVFKLSIQFYQATEKDL